MMTPLDIIFSGVTFLGLINVFDLKGYLPMILDGMVITIEVALLSLTIAVILGIAGASAKLSGSRIAYSISTL